MNTYKHPSEFHPELTNDYIEPICNLLLDIHSYTIQELTSEYDDNYTRGTTVFGRFRNAILKLSKKHNWLILVKTGMDITFKIGDVPIRFFCDDSDNPKKKNVFKLDDEEMGLFSYSQSEPIFWRVMIEKSDGLNETQAVFAGYNFHRKKISEIRFNSKLSLLSSVDKEEPCSVEIPPLSISLRENRPEEETKFK